MRRRALLARIAAFTTPVLAGCAGDGGGNAEATTTTTTTMTPTTTTATATADTTVEMKNTSFNPVKAEVEVGATVKWVNKDGFAHDVTSAQFSSGAKSWDFTKELSSGESTTHTFDKKGVYEYYCTIHGKGTMCGVVLVGGVSYDGSLPCQGGDGGGYDY